MADKAATRDSGASGRRIHFRMHKAVQTKLITVAVCGMLYSFFNRPLCEFRVANYGFENDKEKSDSVCLCHNETLL